MKKLYFLFFTILISNVSFGQVVGDVIVTEIMNNPSSVADSEGEWFEVYNTTSAPIDMEDWVISDNGSNSFTVGESLIIPAGEYIVFGEEENSLINGGVAVDYDYPSSFALANSDDEIILTFSSTIIDQVYYDGGPNFPDPNGKSMELNSALLDATSNDSGSNWAEATTTFGDGDLGTPGGTNGVALSTTDIQIEGFSVYPNPVANSQFKITTASSVDKNVRIFNMLGKQVYSKTVSANETVNVSNLTSGIYFVNVEEEGKTATKKLVIK